jgi:hypothetical protein
VVIDFVDESQQNLLLLRQRGTLEIANDTLDELLSIAGVGTFGFPL